MSVIVQKYGGSSVSDVEKIGLVADRICAARDEGYGVVVVVSAMGKTTDELLGLARSIDPNPPRRELDLLLSTGERVSMTLLSMALQRRGCDAISFTGSQSGILTNDWHFDAKILEVRPVRVLDELARGRVVIVAGYQGMSYKREVTTLGRGGSDTTALAMAAALSAERAEIYSDVDGVYSADPRVVPDARHLPELTYVEMQSMSDAGAKVLHAPAVEFARGREVPIHCRATFAPGRETRISNHALAHRRPFAVVGQPGIARLWVAGSDRERRLALQTTRAHSVLPFFDERGEDTTELRIATAHVPDWGRTRDVLLAHPHIRLEEGVSRVSLVGGSAEVQRASLRAELAEAGVGVLAVDVDPHGERVSALVPSAQTDVAVRALHERVVLDPEAND
ncbi:MAG: aspartate kinase [Sandaracinaceae bacterium]|nr:aspartate kinase [Sandaracinaceae bacterium]